MSRSWQEWRISWQKRRKTTFDQGFVAETEGFEIAPLVIEVN